MSTNLTFKKSITSFLEKIVEQYRNARVPFEPHTKLFRGESRAISSIAEDIFANTLVESYTDITSVLINQTLTSTTHGHKLRIKPDIVVLVNNVAVIMFDLKMDLGYSRDEAPSNIEAAAKKFNALKSHTMSYHLKVGDIKSKKELKFSEGCVYSYIVITDQNINKDKFSAAHNVGKNTHGFRFFTLLHGVHPNKYNISKDDMITEIKKGIDHEELSLLDLLITDCLKPELYQNNTM